MAYSSMSSFGAFNPSLPGCGDKREDVIYTQRALNALGFTDSRGQKLREDGVAGTATSEAMAKYSVARGLGFLGTAAQGNVCAALWEDYKQLLANPGATCPPGQQRQFGMCVPSASLPGIQPQPGGSSTQPPSSSQTGAQACKADEVGIYPLCYKRSDAEAIAAQLAAAARGVVPQIQPQPYVAPYPPPSERQGGMTTQAKVALGVGGGVLALAIIGGIIYATRSKRA